jgi:putative Ca2+/H+ antiporter (TMEM165/GDT1 family)
VSQVKQLLASYAMSVSLGNIIGQIVKKLPVIFFADIFHKKIMRAVVVIHAPIYFFRQNSG